MVEQSGSNKVHALDVATLGVLFAEIYKDGVKLIHTVSLLGEKLYFGEGAVQVPLDLVFILGQTGLGVGF